MVFPVALPGVKSNAGVSGTTAGRLGIVHVPAIILPVTLSHQLIIVLPWLYILTPSGLENGSKVLSSQRRVCGELEII